MLLPQPAERSAAPWFALLATPLVLATDSLAHAVLVVVVMVIVIGVLTLLERITRETQEEIRDCIVLVVAAGLARSADLVLLAYAFPVYRSVALLVPTVLAAAYVHMMHLAAPQQGSPTLHAELLVGLLVVSVGREFVGHGSLLHDFSGSASMSLFPPEMGFFLAALAPGAFIALGILLALIRWLRRPRTVA